MRPILRWLLGCVALLLMLLAGPMWMLASNQVVTDGHWSTLDRSSAGLAPDPAKVQEAVVQVYAARAYSWRGAFGVHIWIATKTEGAAEYYLHQVLSWRRPTVVSSVDSPDRAWFGHPPELLADYRGDDAARLIPIITDAVARYPYTDLYRVWPGPNSNSFIAWVIREVEGLDVALPTTAVGKDYLFNEVVTSVPSGTGYQLSLGGVMGIMVAREEGIEINVLGLSVGLDIQRPALKLPGVGRLGMPPKVMGSND
ncbi:MULTISPECIES: DUF3750 domain-containing protein [Vreelandella]|uniref:DUF3750 domain-containing protein n=2 Tax=Vreelandella TaxID=3137766 RepID=A0A7C9JSI4_9GAMM|nr:MULTISPECIES: DUF3750 domain-containing protein [Halomonas]NDL70564.1 DUF3750 domain-containing protein [Halomonas alkaliphila]NYS43746.1 DUF3750 domain-containing protein [Halomonas zhaodongensis]